MQPPNWYAPPRTDVAPNELASDLWRAPLEPGTFGIRGTAQVIDTVIGLIVAFVAGAAGGFVVGVLAAAGIVPPGWESRLEHAGAGTFLMGLFASLFYHAVAESLGGATLGKVICGLRVLTDRREPCTLPKAIGRNLAYYIDSLFFGMVAWSAMSNSPQRQRYGDRWAGTIVVYKRSAGQIPMRNPALGITIAFAGYIAIHASMVIIDAF